MINIVPDLCGAFDILSPNKTYQFVEAPFLLDPHFKTMTIRKDHYGQNYPYMFRDESMKTLVSAREALDLSLFQIVLGLSFPQHTLSKYDDFSTKSAKIVSQNVCKWVGLISQKLGVSKDCARILSTTRVIHDLMRQTAQCLDMPVTELYLAFISNDAEGGYKRRDPLVYSWHQDQICPADPQFCPNNDDVGLIVTFKGAKTLFKNETSEAMEPVPEGHLVVMTMGSAFGAWHAAPIKKDEDNARTLEGSRERFTVLLSGKKRYPAGVIANKRSSEDVGENAAEL